MKLSAPFGTPEFSMATQSPSPSDDQLFATPADFAAVDALFGDARAGQEPARESRVVRLLSLLNLTPTSDDVDAKVRGDALATLVDVTFARVIRTQQRDLAGRIVGRQEPPALSELSAQAFDSVLGTSNLAGSHADERAARAAAVCALLDSGIDAPTPAERDALISSTLERIQSEFEADRERFRLAPMAEQQTVSYRGSIRLADLVSIAAVFLVATAIMWPVLMSVREQARETQCASNLSRAALGFTTYAADHRNQMPRAEASVLGGSWWNVGEESRSHSANLYVLVSKGYASLSDLACPGNAHAPTIRLDPEDRDWRTPEEVSFSYQLFARRPPVWGQNPRLVALSDRSPVVDRARRGERFDPEASSLNHSGRAQNILFGDGSVRLYFRPVLENGDNIWLPASMEEIRFLTGREQPANDQDAFVGP